VPRKATDSSPHRASSPDSNASVERSPAVSLRDLADKLGVAASTVSRALKNHPRISAALRERVQATAEAAGYRADPMLSALAQYRLNKQGTRITAELAWINHWPEPELLRSFREFDEYWLGAAEAAERNGFRLQEHRWEEHQGSLGRLWQILRSRNVQGIFIPPHPGVALDWTGFDWTDFCIVRFGHSIPSPRSHVVTSNQLLNARLALRETRQLGYERVGFVTNEHMTNNTVAMAGFLMEQHVCPEGHRLPPLILAKEHHQKVQIDRLQQWLKQWRPDAVLSDLGDLRSNLQSLGYRVPEDIAMATMSVLDGGVDAGIDQQSHAIGRAAAEVLCSRIRNHDRGLPATCRETLLEGRWRHGASLPPRLRSVSSNQ
jgi:DNA-binding LacI/PurR family transcriptional regulator